MSLTLARTPAPQALQPFLDDADLADSAGFPDKPADREARRRHFLDSLDAWSGPQRQCWLFEDSREGRGFALYRRSAWDTEAFGVPSGFVEAVHARPATILPQLTAELADRLAAQGDVFVTRKVGLERIAEVQANEAAGFRTVDCELVFCQETKDMVPPAGLTPSPGVIVAVNPDLDRDAALSLPPHPSRFAADPRIGPEKARALWDAIVQQCLGPFGDVRFVALSAGRPVGLICLFENRVPGEDLPTGRLFLVGCEAPWQGTGLMRALMEAVREHARRRYARLVVETSAVNHRAQAFYLSCGFRGIAAANLSMHLWARQTPRP